MNEVAPVLDKALAGEPVQLATGHDGLRALAIADAAQRSHDSELPVAVQ